MVFSLLRTLFVEDVVCLYLGLCDIGDANFKLGNPLLDEFQLFGIQPIPNLNTLPRDVSTLFTYHFVDARFVGKIPDQHYNRDNGYG